ncbi:hypothetical protein RB601_004883 [Gaeumannomyces tritici]
MRFAPDHNSWAAPSKAVDHPEPPPRPSQIALLFNLQIAQYVSVPDAQAQGGFGSNPAVNTQSRSRRTRQSAGNAPSDEPRRSRGIAGPTSALTDYLAANNISAADIARNHQRRQQAALADAVVAESSARASGRATSTAAVASSLRSAGLARGLENASSVAALADKVHASLLKKKLTKVEHKAIEHYKTTPEFIQAKDHYAGDVEDDDTLARMFYFAAQKAVGQFENCAECGKRFTVTNYTLASPSGGLLCSPCGKDLDTGDGPKKKKQKVSSGQVGKRRKQQSRVLDGAAPIGTKSLVTLCIEHLSRNIDLAEDLGYLPEHVVDRIARILSKRRQMNSRTLPLFLQSDTRTLNIYDAGLLCSDDFVGIFQAVRGLKSLKVRHGIQFKNEVVEQMLDKFIRLESLSLKGCNLITSDMWERIFKDMGGGIKTFQTYCNADYFTDKTVGALAENCPNLKRLKLVDNKALTAQALEPIGQMKELEHLSLKIKDTIPNPAFVSLLDSIGSNLQTLSLMTVENLNDTVLQAIRRNCTSLSKLRITDSERLTDDAFARMFTGWTNGPLRFVEFSKCRLTEAKLGGVNDDGIGLCDAGFVALMEHSGRKIEHLGIDSCRHISTEAFIKVFSEDKTYPQLETLELSFCGVNDFIVGSIFRSCPAIKWVKVFGCMNVRNVLVPRGKILIGVPNAIGMQIEGYH